MRVGEGRERERREEEKGSTEVECVKVQRSKRNGNLKAYEWSVLELQTQWWAAALQEHEVRRAIFFNRLETSGLHSKL